MPATTLVPVLLPSTIPLHSHNSQMRRPSLTDLFPHSLIPIWSNFKSVIIRGRHLHSDFVYIRCITLFSPSPDSFAIGKKPIANWRVNFFSAYPQNFVCPKVLFRLKDNGGIFFELCPLPSQTSVYLIRNSHTPALLLLDSC